MKATTKILALCAALCGMSAGAQSGVMINDTDYVTEATYSLNINQAEAQVSSLLGGQALPNSASWTEYFGDFVDVRTGGDKAATLKKGNNPWNNTEVLTDTSSVLLVTKLSGTANGILFSFSAYKDSAYAIIQRSTTQIAFVKSTDNGTDLITADVPNGGSQFHTIIFTAETVEGQYKYSLYVDGTLGGSKTLDTSIAVAGYQFGATPQGSNPSGLDYGTGVQMDEFGAWTDHVLTADEIAAIAKAYPLWPTETTEVSTEVSYDDIKDATSISVTDTGVINLGTTFDRDSKDALKAFLAKVSGTGTIVVGNVNMGEFPTSAFTGTGCTVKFSRTTCWITANTALSFDVVLDADYNGESALTVDGANSGATYTFSGTISGSGSVKYSQTDGRTCTFSLTGDLSDWTGNFVNCNNSAAVKVPEGFDSSRITINDGRALAWTTASSMTTYVTRAAGSDVTYKSGGFSVGMTVSCTVNGTVYDTAYAVADTLNFTSSPSGNIYIPYNCDAVKLAIAEGVTLKSGHDDYNGAGKLNIPLNSSITIGEGGKLVLEFWGHGQGNGNATISTATIDGEGTWGYDSGDSTQLDLWGAITGTAALTIGANEKVVVHGTLATPVRLTAEGATLQCSTAMAEGLVTTDLEGYHVAQNGNTYTVSPDAYKVTFDCDYRSELTITIDGTTIEGDDYSVEAGATLTFALAGKDGYTVTGVTGATETATAGTYVTDAINAATTITITMKKSTDWPTPESVAQKTASEAFGITGELADVTASQLVTWAKGNGNVAYSDMGSIKTNAFLLNCENTDEAIEEAKKNFKCTITVEADGTITITTPEGYNGIVQKQGKETLSATESWKDITDDETTGYNFFRAELKIGTAN